MGCVAESERASWQISRSPSLGHVAPVPGGAVCSHLHIDIITGITASASLQFSSLLRKSFTKRREGTDLLFPSDVGGGKLAVLT